MTNRFLQFITLSVFLFIPTLAYAQRWGGIAPQGAILTTGIIAAIAGGVVGGLIVAWRKLPPQVVAWIVIGTFVTALIIGEASDNILIETAALSSSGIIGFAVGLGAVLAFFVVSSDKEGVRLPNVFGTAKWASLSDLKEWKLIGNLKKATGLLIGGTAQIGEEVIYEGQMHTLTVAPTRAGKGASFIIPNLLRLDSSVLVIDPKGENARRTAARREAMGHHVFIVDPWQISKNPDQYGPGADPKNLARYNPLDALNAKDPDLVTDAMMLADALIIPTGGENRFWDEEAKGLIFGFILYLVTDDREKDSRHLGRLRDILTLPLNVEEDSDPDTETIAEILIRMSNSDHTVVRSAAARFLAKNEKEGPAVLSSAQSNTHFLDSPALRDSLKSSNFSFAHMKLAKKPVTVYLVLPLDRLPTFNRWLRLMVISALKDLMRIPQPQGKPQVRVILDEFAALEKLDMVEKAYGTMAGLGVQLCAITQDLAQMERIYGQGWQTFISNAGVFQYYGSRDKKTAEYASSLCGMTTVKKISRGFSSGTSSSTSSGSGGFSSTTGTSSGENVGVDDVSRPLIYADELMRLPEWAQVVFVENRDPIACRKVNWFEDDTLKAMQGGSAVAAPVAKPQPQPVAAVAKETESAMTTEGVAAQEQRARQRKEAVEQVKKAGATVGKVAKFAAQKLSEGRQKMADDVKDQEPPKGGQ